MPNLGLAAVNQLTPASCLHMPAPPRPETATPRRVLLVETGVNMTCSDLPASPRSRMSAARHLHDAAEHGRALWVAGALSEASGRQPRGTWATVTGDAVQSVMRDVVYLAGAELPSEFAKFLERVPSVPVHAAEALERLACWPCRTKINLEHGFSLNQKTFVATACMYMVDLATALADSVQLQALRHSSDSLVFETKHCTAGHTLASSPFLQRIRDMARQDLHVPLHETVVPFSLTHDMSQLRGTAAYCVRVVPLCFGQRIEPRDWLALAMLPASVTNDVRVFHVDSAAGHRRLVSASHVTPATLRAILGALQKAGLLHVARAIAELQAHAVPLIVSGQTIRARFVLGTHVLDMQERFGTWGLLQRWSSSPSFEFNVFQAYSGPRGQCQFTERRTPQRDVEYLRSNHGSLVGIDKDTYESSPLRQARVWCPMLYDGQAPADLLHDLDGAVTKLFAVFQCLVGAGPSLSLCALYGNTALGASSVADSISDRVSSFLSVVPSLLALVLSTPSARQSTASQAKRSAFRTLLLAAATLLDLVACLTDPAPRLLLDVIAKLSRQLRTHVQTLELRLQSVWGKETRVLTPKLLELATVFHELVRNFGCPRSVSTTTPEKCHRSERRDLAAHGTSRSAGSVVLRCETARDVADAVALLDCDHDRQHPPRAPVFTWSSLVRVTGDKAPVHVNADVSSVRRRLGREAARDVVVRGVVDAYMWSSAALSASPVNFVGEVAAELAAEFARALGNTYLDSVVDISSRCKIFLASELVDGEVRSAEALPAHRPHARPLRCRPRSLKRQRATRKPAVPVYSENFCSVSEIGYGGQMKALAVAVNNVPLRGSETCDDPGCLPHSGLQLMSSRAQDESTCCGLPLLFSTSRDEDEGVQCVVAFLAETKTWNSLDEDKELREAVRSVLAPVALAVEAHVPASRGSGVSPAPVPKPRVGVVPASKVRGWRPLSPAAVPYRTQHDIGDVAKPYDLGSFIWTVAPQRITAFL